MHSAFSGVSGAVIVSIIAFSIVFGVLIILTGMIYAMRLFTGKDHLKLGGTGGGAPASKAAAPAAAVAAAPAAGAAQSKIVAAITAAIMAATGGRGRILSIVPATVGGAPFSTWRASGIVALVNNRLSRPWSR